MKTIIIILFSFLSLKTYSQITDLIYIPKDKSVVGTLKYTYSPIGIYAGGYVTKNFPQPFTYTTPMSILSRAGLNLVGNRNRWGLMLGCKIDSYDDKVLISPDYWIKIYPLKIITNTPNGFDFVVILNYDDKLNYGVGLSIPFGGIY